MKYSWHMVHWSAWTFGWQSDKALFYLWACKGQQ